MGLAFSFKGWTYFKDTNVIDLGTLALMVTSAKGSLRATLHYRQRPWPRNCDGPWNPSRMLYDGNLEFKFVWTWVFKFCVMTHANELSTEYCFITISLGKSCLNPKPHEVMWTLKLSRLEFIKNKWMGSLLALNFHVGLPPMVHPIIIWGIRGTKNL